MGECGGEVGRRCETFGAAGNGFLYGASRPGRRGAGLTQSVEFLAGVDVERRFEACPFGKSLVGAAFLEKNAAFLEGRGESGAAVFDRAISVLFLAARGFGFGAQFLRGGFSGSRETRRDPRSRFVARGRGFGVGFCAAGGLVTLFQSGDAGAGVGAFAGERRDLRPLGDCLVVFAFLIKGLAAFERNVDTRLAVGRFLFQAATAAFDRSAFGVKLAYGLVKIGGDFVDRNSGRRSGSWRIGCQRRVLRLEPEILDAAGKTRVFGAGDELVPEHERLFAAAGVEEPLPLFERCAKLGLAAFLLFERARLAGLRLPKLALQFFIRLVEDLEKLRGSGKLDRLGRREGRSGALGLDRGAVAFFQAIDESPHAVPFLKFRGDGLPDPDRLFVLALVIKQLALLEGVLDLAAFFLEGPACFGAARLGNRTVRVDAA